MSVDVDTAVVGRWNAASLNTSIAPLYPGDENAVPEATPLPRASYFSVADPLESESRGTLVSLKTYTFEVFGTNYETVGGYVRSIEDSMLNSEQSTTNPLVMASNRGKILSTHKSDEGIVKEADALFRGFYSMIVRWRKNKVTP